MACRIFATFSVRLAYRSAAGGTSSYFDDVDSNAKSTLTRCETAAARRIGAAAAAAADGDDDGSDDEKGRCWADVSDRRLCPEAASVIPAMSLDWRRLLPRQLSSIRCWRCTPAVGRSSAPHRVLRPPPR